MRLFRARRRFSTSEHFSMNKYDNIPMNRSVFVCGHIRVGICCFWLHTSYFLQNIVHVREYVDGATLSGENMFSPYDNTAAKRPRNGEEKCDRIVFILVFAVTSSTLELIHFCNGSISYLILRSIFRAEEIFGLAKFFIMSSWVQIVGAFFFSLVLTPHCSPINARFSIELPFSPKLARIVSQSHCILQPWIRELRSVATYDLP